MKDLINKDSLERILRKSWFDFMDKTKLIAFLLECVRDSNFKKVKSSSKMKSAIQFTVSRFELQSKGFLIWIDFIIPQSEKTEASGTSEIIISYNGEIIHQHTTGQIQFVD